MNNRQKQLIERDVRKLAPETNASVFMNMYINSNFPQTSALPSPAQEAGLIPTNNEDNILKFMKKPLSGTKYDNPGGF